jgi:hypothetical protein
MPMDTSRVALHLAHGCLRVAHHDIFDQQACFRQMGERYVAEP